MRRESDMVGLTDIQRRVFRDEGVLPEGWRWCPDCNGEGFVYMMQATPEMDERRYDCRRCEDELGIVPAQEASDG